MNTIRPDDKRVDVRAKIALPKMLQQPSMKNDAERLIQGINSGELAAIYRNDIRAAVDI